MTVSDVPLYRMRKSCDAVCLILSDPQNHEGGQNDTWFKHDYSRHVVLATTHSLSSGGNNPAALTHPESMYS